MRILGAGGCFENRIYEHPVSVLWAIAIQVLFEQGIEVLTRDDSKFLIEGRAGKKIFNVCIKKLDNESSQVIVDSRKKTIQVYSWKKESDDVDTFYELFEQKVNEYESYVICPKCNSQISSSSKFCPNCGMKIQ